MANAFLLRFQDSCAEDDSATVLGTATKTSVAREQPDTDPSVRLYSALASGTETVTKTATELRDSDATADSKALPREIIMGTQTATAVRAEASDTDPGHLVNRVLRR